MATKKIKIGDNEITIRGLKIKEVKALGSKFNEQLEAINGLINSKDTEFKIGEFIKSNYNLLTEILLDHAPNYTIYDFEELDIMEAFELIKEFLAFNGLTEKRISDFFGLIRGALVKPVPQKISENLLFQPQKVQMP